MRLEQDNNKYLTMKSIRFISIVAALVCNCLMSMSQNYVEAPLTNAQKEEIKLRVKQKCDDFQTHLKDVADIQLSSNNRDEALIATKVLFIGECDPYKYYNLSNQRFETDTVKLWTSSKYTQKKKKNYTGRYLRTLRNMIRGQYNKILIEQAGAVRVDNIYPTGNGEYECMAYIAQKFIGFGAEGRIKYQDFTTKKVRVKIRKIEIPTPDGTQNVWDAKLENIYALETK